MSDSHDTLDRAEQALDRATQALASVDRYLRISNVADRLGMTPQYVRELCRAGKLPAYRFGRCWRVKLSDLHRFCESQRVA